MTNTRFVVRRGYTLIEILLAVTLGLMLMLGVVQVFAMVGNMVTNSQAIMEMDQKVRSAQLALQNDLVRYTCRMTPPADPTAAEGYFKIEENTQTSTINDNRVADLYNSTVTGDSDDVLTFTIHDLDSPFIGRNGGIRSEDAEVKWHVAQNADGFYSLYRRVNVLNSATGGNPTQAVTNGVKTASLSDLTFSDYRGGWAEDNTKDIVLDNILMFDVKVWDSKTWDANSGAYIKNYVDIGVAPDGPDGVSNGSTFGASRGKTYDTGSRFKTSGEGVKNTDTTGADTAKAIGAPQSNNFDMVSPNYAGIRLQGIQIRVRTFEPTSGVIRDFTVEQEFVTH